MRCPSCDQTGYDPAKSCPHCRFRGDPELVQALAHIDWVLGEIDAWRAYEAHPVTKERLRKRYTARQRQLEIELGLRLKHIEGCGSVRQGSAHPRCARSIVGATSPESACCAAARFPGGRRS